MCVFTKDPICPHVITYVRRTYIRICVHVSVKCACMFMRVSERMCVC